MPLFDTLNKAFADAQEQDKDKINKRKSKRFSKFIAHNDELNLDLDEPPVLSKIILSSTTGRTSSGSDFEEDDEDLIEDRPKWDKDYIVLIFMIGYVTGLSNVWRFGYLCKVYGGIAFLIPYSLLTLVCAFPCLYLELLIGQYAQVGAIASWKFCPLFKGVGMCMTLLGFMASMNIQSVLAWCLFYMFQSAFYAPLPWISCDNGFARLKSGQKDKSMESWFLTESQHEETINWHTVNCTDFFADAGTDDILQPNQRLPGAEFFRGRVQRMWKSWYSDAGEKNFTVDNGVIMFGFDKEEDGGGILAYNRDTMMSLIGVFIIIEIVVSKGIKLNSTVLLILVGFPYVILILLFYRATGLRGAGEGLVELFRPNYTQLYSSETWWRCAEQVFYTTGVGYGVHLTSASHNQFHHRIVYDAVFTVLVNSLTSLISACTIFMFLGHVKVALNKDLNSFVRSGPQLVFEVMADILGVLPKANFYAFCFYSFLFFLGLTTISVFLICAKQAYLEVLPVSVKYKSGARMLLVTVIFASSFVVSSLNLTRGGLHTYNFIGTFVGLYSLVLCAWLFLIGISWFFGLRAIVEGTKAMGIRCPGIFYQICWKFINPLIFGAIFIGIASNPESHEVTFDGRKIELGIGLTIVGYIVGIGPSVTVIGGAIHALFTAPGKNLKEKLLISISPSIEHQEILATGTGERAKASHYFYLYEPTEGAKLNVCCTFHGHSKVAPEEKVALDSFRVGDKRNSDPNGKSKEPKDKLKDPPPPPTIQVVQAEGEKLNKTPSTEKAEKLNKTPSSEIKAEKLNKTPSSEIKAEKLNKTPSSEIKAEKLNKTLSSETPTEEPGNSDPSPVQNQKRDSKNSRSSQEEFKKKKRQCLIQ